MENDPLDKWLGLAAAKLPSAAPADLESRVWREIRLRRSKAAKTPGWLTALASFWNQTQTIGAALALALFIGVFMGQQATRTASTPWARSAHRHTGESLGLWVFSVDPPAVPSTLLAQQP